MHDDEAFRRLFDDGYRPLLAYARRRVSEPADADDVVAETFAIAWRRRDDLPGGDDERRAYLFGIARRVLANRRRGDVRRWRLVTRLRGTVTPASADPAVVATEGDVAVLRALGRLRERDREILRLAAWDGLDHTQIAAALGLTPSGVASRLHRARARLAEELAATSAVRADAGRSGT